ncbi:hypothetical protein SPRG_15360 [Saprolegnia parasitica CBS 223.65]|uniref:Uncharacterized protein n=1 Tax=Saprolegnia parasitica (strain CBS 223.65) TaxID=695850 RepID=A0A067BRM9_SAPPC|nr:hypothetical protein SPRG_15360 [Saprolegnia parasitica CBS 223.65]KDO19455.1 hypothetical protein SPRG_15360 [Saprolegnia parasitica CBS 223.65]|eukprot:XP_012209838.1 hypothetical protein SPRG_15360 [Saprolegnia parasitica CBS 223.65]
MAQASTASLEVPRLPLEPRRLQTAPASPRPVHSPTTRSPRKEAWRSPAPSPRQMTTTPRKPTPRKEPELATRPIDAATTVIAANSAAKTSDEPELITRDDVAREVLIATAIVSSALDDAMVQAANEALRRSFDPPPSTPSPPDALASIAKDGIFAQLFQEVPRSPVRHESKDTDDIVLATMTVLVAEAKNEDTARSIATDEVTVTASNNVTGEDTAASVAMALLAKQLTLALLAKQLTLAWVYHAAASVVDDATSILDEMTVTVATLSPECTSVDARDDATSDANDATSEDILGATNEETIIARPPSLARIDAKRDMDLEAAFTEAIASESTGDADARPSELESTSLLDDEPTTKVAAAILDALSRDVSSPRLVESALVSETTSDAAALQAQLATEAPSESFDEAVLISIVAGRLVRAWMHTTTDEIASSRPHEHDLQAPMQVPDSNPVPDFVSPLVSARDIIPSTVPSLLNLTLDMASQLVHAWTEAAVRAMTTHRDSAVTSVAIETVAPAPVVTVIDSPCLDNCPPINASIQTVPMTEEEEDSMCSQVATSILAGHLVRAWIADTIAEVAWFTSRPHEHDAAVPSLNNATPSSLLEKAAALASAPETIDASEMATHDNEVAVAFLAGRLVRTWVYETCGVIAERALACTAASLAPLDVCDEIDSVVVWPAEISKDETPQDDMVDVAASVLVAQLVRAWLYETMNGVAQQLSARHFEPSAVAPDCVVASTSLSVAATTLESPLALEVPISDDETTDDDIVDVAASVLAGQLVRAWLYETMHEVVQFSARRHEHAADASACAVTEAPASPVVVDDAPPTFSMAPVIIDGAELETSDDSMVTVSILAAQLVNAWVYETMDNCITQRSAEQLELKTSNSLSELQPSRRTTDEELSPGSDGTSAVEPLADDISDASLVVAVSILAGQLVRMWVYDVMDSIVQRSIQQLASALNVADDAPLVAIDAVSADGKASDEPRDDTVAASIFAGQLVRAWTYDVINEIAQVTARRHEHAPSCADAETVVSSIVITETETADAETADTETSDAVDVTREQVAVTTNTAGLLSTNVQEPPEEAEILEPSASEMDEINRTVAASMLSGSSCVDGCTRRSIILSHRDCPTQRPFCPPRRTTSQPTTLVHRWLVDAVAKAVDDAALESSDSETATSYVSSSDSRSSLSSYSSESASSYGSSSLSSSKASSVSDLHASSVSSLSPLDEAS